MLLGESLRWTIQQSVAMKNSNATTELSEWHFYTWYIYWINLYSSSEPNIHDRLSVSLYKSYFWLPLYMEPLGQFHKHDAKYPYGVLIEHFEKVLFFKGGGDNHETLKISHSEIIFCSKKSLHKSANIYIKASFKIFKMFKPWHPSPGSNMRPKEGFTFQHRNIY